MKNLIIKVFYNKLHKYKLANVINALNLLQLHKYISMKAWQQSSKQENIKTIFLKDYESRSSNQHKITSSFIQPYFSTLPLNTVKLITFHISVLQVDKYLQNQNKIQNGILIKIVNDNNLPSDRNPEANNQYVIVKNEKIIFLQNQIFGLFISYDNYLTCLTLGETTIQQQLAFFHSSQYLCSMPKKKYYQILRNSKVLSLNFRQILYFEGQMISPGQSGSGVYLVRHGQLSYIKSIKGKNIQVFRFGQGHLFGNLQYENNNNKRLFSVKSKSSRSIVYCMNYEFFNSCIKPYCQNVIQIKQKKLLKFLTEKSNQIEQIRSKNSSILQNRQSTVLRGINFTQTMRRSFSHSQQINNNLKKTNSINMFTSRDLPSLIKTSRLSAQIEEEQLTKTSYMGLKHDGPLKHYPMTSQRSKYMESQFRDIQKLLEKNGKINKIRSIHNNKGQEKRSKNEILFQLFQTSWKFDKQKRKRILNY